MEVFSFKKGFSQVMQKDISNVKHEIMITLGITTNVAWLNRLNGKVEPKVSEAKAIEETFAKYGIKEVWGNDMNATATLTKRESEVAELIAWGASKKEIASRLFIDNRTVENHARSIYEKTGVTKSNELSAWWFCVHFNISFDLSPLKRKVVTLVLLLLVVSTEFTNAQNLRTFRSGRKVECRARRARRKSEANFDYLLEL